MAEPGTITSRRLGPGPVALTLLAGAVCAVVAVTLVGGRGALSAALAAVLVLGFFRSGRLPLVLAGGPVGGLAVVVLLTNYVLRLALALLLLVAAVEAGWVDRRALGISVIVCGLAYVNGAVLRLVRAR